MAESEGRTEQEKQEFIAAWESHIKDFSRLGGSAKNAEQYKNVMAKIHAAQDSLRAIVREVA